MWVTDLMKRLYDFFKALNKESIAFLMMLLASQVVLFLFETPIQINFVLFLVQMLVFLYYIIVSFFSYKKEENTKEKIDRLENQLRKEKEKNTEYVNNLNDYFLIWVHQIKTPITSLKLFAENFDEKKKKRLK